MELSRMEAIFDWTRRVMVCVVVLFVIGYPDVVIDWGRHGIATIGRLIGSVPAGMR